ncbi:odorant receptor 4-like [Homalodisca vitripennis]|uniref:odorant receptor 4-like n=1 Tax=Homalodisca vitripennis TaxID=197043 RepID=UPI001EEB4099|nr:odorant receptor 4-like [Homalodisca vitripennis]
MDSQIRELGMQNEYEAHALRLDAGTGALAGRGDHSDFGFSGFIGQTRRTQSRLTTLTGPCRKSVKLLNDCFSLSALVLVQATSLIAALTLPRAILITKLPIWDLYFVLSSGCGVLILSFFLCYFGQVIEDESNNLRRALYDYNWYNQTQRFKAHVMIMITMATRPLQLTAGGIYPLNFETFTYVMSAFYSYVHFLLALKEKGKIG